MWVTYIIYLFTFTVRSKANLHFDKDNVETRQRSINVLYSKLTKLAQVSSHVFCVCLLNGPVVILWQKTTPVRTVCDKDHIVYHLGECESPPMDTKLLKTLCFHIIKVIPANTSITSLP